MSQSERRSRPCRWAELLEFSSGDEVHQRHCVRHRYLLLERRMSEGRFEYEAVEASVEQVRL